MAIDTGVFDKIKTFQDYAQAQQAFDLQKQKAMQDMLASQQGSNLPAALQLANEYKSRLAAGDSAGANQLLMFAKAADKGVFTDASGTFQEAPGYGAALGGIKYGERTGQNQSDLQYKPSIAGAEQQAKKNVDIVADPLIASGESEARLRQQLKFEPQIKAATDITANAAKKGAQGSDALSIISDIESPDESGKTLLDKASGSYLGAGSAFLKGVVGTSDENTQANAQLKVLGNRLILNVPRMEGPQSDKDTALYRAAAGQIADPTVPGPDKAAALIQIKKISSKYASPTASAMPGQGGLDSLLADKQMQNAAPKLSDADVAQALFDARKAIKGGKDPAAVRQRLIDNGIDPAGL